jgi:hypothetical protein
MSEALMAHMEEQLAQLEELAERIPKEHRGILFERVLKAFHPQENTRRLELGFAETWAERNSPEAGALLLSLLCADTNDPRAEFIPRSEREWQVAYLAAATIMQWLPTSVGCSFLAEAFRKGGGEFRYTLPNVD